jgi:biofilm protein TabA
MIYDLLKNIKNYKGLNKNFDEAIDFVMNNDLSKLPVGITTLSDNVFYNRFDASFKPIEERVYESHEVYADLHIDVEGDEWIGYDHISNLTGQTEYNKDDDYYNYDSKIINPLKLDNTRFALFMPNEGHAPNVKANSDNNKKLVVKIKW